VATTDPKSSVYKGSISTVTCSSCHSQERIIRKYGLASERFQTYEDSFHGLADKLGDTTVANCSSCHGIHNIYPSSDPRSTVNAKNLPSTCGSCHPQMTAGVVGKIHGETTGSIGFKINTTIKWVYYFLIAATIGFMVFHNFIDWLKKFREQLQKKSGMVSYQRLDLNERMMHLLLMLTFITLVITGFMLVFHVPLPFMTGTDSQKFRAVAHRLSAIGFIFWCIWHAIYLAFTKRGHSWVRSILPTKKDMTDAIQYVQYNLGVRKTKPSFERFSYIEKAEYLALVWGTIIMIITGLILWFKEYFARWLPFWGFEVTTTIHLMEAVLATLSIIVWHLYFVIFNPDVGPMATWWLTGKMTEEEMHHEHPLELEKIKSEPPASLDAGRPGKE
jgi:cytochrome b subunit of formate dehydrogenase